MNVGDLALQALMSVLIGMMVYFWFLTSLIPHGQSIFEIQQNLDNAYKKINSSEEISPP